MRWEVAEVRMWKLLGATLENLEGRGEECAAGSRAVGATGCYKDRGSGWGAGAWASRGTVVGERSTGFQRYSGRRFSTASWWSIWGRMRKGKLWGDDLLLFHLGAGVGGMSVIWGPQKEPDTE